MRRLLSLGLLLGCSSSDPVVPVDAGAEAASDAAEVSVPTCKRGPKETAIPATCAGLSCDRAFDSVTFAMTHNAMSNQDEGYAAPNQHHGIARQLADGVQGLMLDVHYYDEETGATDARRDDLPVLSQLYLCHANCRLGRRPLVEGLCDVTAHLDAHRGEIVSIIFETYVRDADLAQGLEAAGLSGYAYTHPGGAWPKLGALVTADTRAILFVESGGGSPAYLHAAWQHIQDTPYTYAKASEFTCALNRGKRSNPLFLINHWVQDPLANPARAAEVNGEAVLLGRAKACAAEVGRPPNFLGVDFYDLGDAVKVAKTLSGG
ncbi:MAG: hypothetical protein JNL79_05015 [Myxococcales bacterium]|nr:hypothetical protein [Myxococcales bacterium]